MDISSSVLARFRFKFELEVKGDGGIEGGGGVKASAEVKRLLRLLNKYSGSTKSKSVPVQI